MRPWARAYQALGIGAFILSGYPQATECDLFARHGPPRMEHRPLGGRAPGAEFR